jgi:predicted kinase
MYILVLNGSSCSGKSTIIKGLMKSQKNLFHLSYDSLKWSFSKYNSKSHYNLVFSFLLKLAELAFEKGYNMVSDASLYREDREDLIALAKKYSYRLIEINLEADFSVLEERFRERVASALASPNSRISNLSEERFRELFETFEKEKNNEAALIRTDNQDIQKVLGDILKLI